jgi:flavorubredoxin
MNDPQASIHEIGPDTFRISVALPPAIFPGGFTFNQYLVKMPLSKLRYIAFSHVEADECGALTDFLKAAPQAQPVCSQVAAIVSVNDMVDVEPIGMEDGQALELGHHKLRWQSTPHLPHGWECGYLFDETTRNLFCGDLFTQPGTGDEPLTGGDILGPSEAFRHQMDYFSHTQSAATLIDKLAQLEPRLLSCMHGSAWSGDGSAMLRSLGRALVH